MHYAKLKPALEIIVPDSCRHLSNKLKKCIRCLFLPPCFLFLSNYPSLVISHKTADGTGNSGPQSTSERNEYSPYSVSWLN